MRDALFEIDDRDRVVVLVGDVEDLAGGVLHEQFGIGTGGQGVHHLLGRGIDHLNGVVVADRDQHELAVPGELDAARPLADLDGFGDGPRVGIDHRDRVALFVRHIGDEGPRGRGARKPDSRFRQAEQRRHMRDLSIFNAACIWFRADRRRAYRVPRPDAGNLPAARPRPPCGHPPAGSADEAAGSNPAASAAGP